MKFRYYLYYKNSYYHLFDRKTKKDYTKITFYSMYCFIKEMHINFNDVKLKDVTLYTFFRDYASFDEGEIEDYERI